MAATLAVGMLTAVNPAPAEAATVDTSSGPTTRGQPQEPSNNDAILVAPQGLGNGWADSYGEDITFLDDMIRSARPPGASAAGSAIAPGMRASGSLRFDRGPWVIRVGQRRHG
ncbi:hypothetical protein [Streptomyces sp. IB2014 016-6]|uniref:hypothetical protein n=1 Tax=Streptomyces sp. IB2014 016-6 TaxID=2517818 RepID=UPI001F501510|nr:hypothetical protein [Streptomyces sp. IB2014 016-6]